jgi:hypothetical protein
MIDRRQAVAGIAGGGVLAAVAAYLGLVTGAAPLDLGIGRRTRPLGPLRIHISASRETVFDAITAPYAERVPRALQEKVRVLTRGTDMVLAAHYTPIRGRLRATTVETVRFDRPGRVDFRLVRGPVPHVEESFFLHDADGGTALTYSGELGTDLWALGQRWGDLVAARWEAVVKASFDSIKAETERGSRRHSPSGGE